MYAIARICYHPSVRLAVRLSITWVDESKTVEVMIMQLSPQGCPLTLVLTTDLVANFEREPRERWRRIRRVGETGSFQPVSCRISEMMQDRTIVTINH